MAKEFGYPETITYRAGSIVSKTRKVEDSLFEAVAAFFFEGKRRNQKRAFGATRYAAEKAALALVRG